jgi:tetratricopeptide (TPR) repeat protein
MRLYSRLFLPGLCAALLSFPALAAEGEDAPPTGRVDRQRPGGSSSKDPGQRASGRTPRKNPGKVLDPKKSAVADVAAAYKAGEAAFKAENYPGAYEYLVDVAACGQIQGAENFVEQARDLLQQMEKMASDKLEEAKLKKLQGEAAGAMEILKVLVAQFSFSKAAGDARELLNSLAADPRVAAAAQLLQAEDLDNGGNYPEAVAKYRDLTKKYPDSVQALKAKLRLEAMEKDEEISAALKEAAAKAAEADCTKWLKTARNYAANGMVDQARLLFRKVIDNYPDTEYAAEARKAIEELDAGKEKGKEKGKEEAKDKKN